jgi:uncharacterized membrane protein
MPKRVLRKKAKNENSQGLAFIATFFSIIGFIIAYLAWRDDDYVMYYARHSLVIFIISVIAGVLQVALRWIPIVGQISSTALSLLVLALWIVSWVFAITGEKKEIPVITDWARKFKF